MSRRPLLAALLAVLPAASPLRGQDAPPPRVLKVRCLSFQIDGAIPPLFAHSTTAKEDAGGIPVTVRSYLNHEVESLAMSGEQLVFTTDADRASLKDPARLVASVTVPRAVRSAILMFLPGEGKPGGPRCRVLPIEDTTRAFPRGSLKVINLSPLPLRLMLEKTSYDLKSGETRLITDPPTGERNASAMRAFTFKEGKWQRVGAGLWPHPGTKRVLQIAFYNPQSGQLEIRGIRDIAVRDPSQ